VAVIADEPREIEVPADLIARDIVAVVIPSGQPLRQLGQGDVGIMPNTATIYCTKVPVVAASDVFITEGRGGGDSEEISDAWKVIDDDRPWTGWFGHLEGAASTLSSPSPWFGRKQHPELPIGIDPENGHVGGLGRPNEDSGPITPLVRQLAIHPYTDARAFCHVRQRGRVLSSWMIVCRGGAGD
jgi:hypothetical protein